MYMRCKWQIDLVLNNFRSWDRCKEWSVHYANRSYRASEASRPVRHTCGKTGTPAKRKGQDFPGNTDPPGGLQRRELRRGSQHAERSPNGLYFLTPHDRYYVGMRLRIAPARSREPKAPGRRATLCGWMAMERFWRGGGSYEARGAPRANTTGLRRQA